MDSRRTLGASGKEPRIAWLPMTMNSFSPVTPLDARRMCSRSERFILAQDAHAFVLRHEDCERTALSHSHGVFTAVGKPLQHSRQAARLDEVVPFGESIFGVNRIVR